MTVIYGFDTAYFSADEVVKFTLKKCMKIYSENEETTVYKKVFKNERDLECLLNNMDLDFRNLWIRVFKLY